MKTTIVTTTINIPTALLDYAENARAYRHRHLDFIVIGDRKSPPETSDFCTTVAQYYPCAYYDLAAQRDYLARFPELWNHLRFDSIQRRNIGMLMAWENGADIVITIDDDNFCTSHDFVGLHSCAGREREMTAYASTSGWFNVCSFLAADDGVRFCQCGLLAGRSRYRRPHANGTAAGGTLLQGALGGQFLPGAGHLVAL